MLKNTLSDWASLKNGPSISGVREVFEKTLAQIKTANFGLSKPAEDQHQLGLSSEILLNTSAETCKHNFSECLFDDLPILPNGQASTDLSVYDVTERSADTYNGKELADPHENLSSTAQFMQNYVEALFHPELPLTPEQKADFGILIQEESGRTYFARFIDSKRGRYKNVNEITFYGLVKDFALALFECHDSEDFAAAKSIMNMCFTFGYDTGAPGSPVQYPYMQLRGQALFKNTRFWNAAFFQTVQESQKEHMANGRNGEAGWRENITFGVLGAFLCNMHALGLRKDFCMDFLYKQSNISSLPFDETRELLDYVDNLYAEAL